MNSNERFDHALLVGKLTRDYIQDTDFFQRMRSNVQRERIRNVAFVNGFIYVMESTPTEDDIESVSHELLVRFVKYRNFCMHSITPLYTRFKGLSPFDYALSKAYHTVSCNGEIISMDEKLQEILNQYGMCDAYVNAQVQVSTIEKYERAGLVWFRPKENLPSPGIKVKVLTCDDVEAIDYVNLPINLECPFQHYLVKRWRYLTSQEIKEFDESVIAKAGYSVSELNFEAINQYIKFWGSCSLTDIPFINAAVTKWSSAIGSVETMKLIREDINKFLNI